MIFTRPGTGDAKIVHEVIHKRIYRRVKDKFDVEEGEHWLDLGANIGAFAIYCSELGASAECYEPNPSNFDILLINLPKGCVAHKSAVTANEEDEVIFYESWNKNDHSRFTEFHVNKFVESGRYANTPISALMYRKYNGIKMDIEGSEGPILDSQILPQCDKLVLEYHSSRDVLVENFRRRMEWLRTKFYHVVYPPEMDRIINEGRAKFEKEVMERGHLRTVQYPIHDRLVFCWGAK